MISIDSCSTRRRTQGYLNAIATVTDAQIRAVVNTHHHGDHTFGNCMFPGAAIIGHDRTRTEAIAFGPPANLPFWNGPDWVVGNLHRAYAEHDGAPPGAAINVVEALSEMVACTGGAPLTCLA